ncbi:MAG TPA: GNAT family N-acetyltransferase [Terriglobia bacterium]
MPGAVHAPYDIRPCRGIEELEHCVRLQKQIWGYAEGEVYPLRLFVNLTHIGGQVIGAFTPGADGPHRSRGAFRLEDRPGEMVGFVAAMPAWRDGKRYLHSLSLGVVPGHENQGLGRRLKLEQRKLALAAGIRWIEWTFDPLRAKNAFFNIARLGAISRRYQPDYYGCVRSRLQQGLPSDRLVCEWWLRSARVRFMIASGTASRRPGRKVQPAVEITIPADFGSLARHEPERARRLQRSVRRKFEQCFRRGLAVTGFERDDKIGRYLLEPFHEN